MLAKECGYLPFFIHFFLFFLIKVTYCDVNIFYSLLQFWDNTFGTRCGIKREAKTDFRKEITEQR